MTRSPRRAGPLRRARKKEEPGDGFADRLITTANPTNPASEDYRSLRTNLFYSLVDNPPKVILLTSAGPGEGKSTTCANLGVVLAQAGKSTLIVDCDLRKPIVHRIFGVRNTYGIVDVLAGVRSLEESWHELQQGLKVVTVGGIPPDPSELLGSRRFAEFLDQVRSEFDYVLLDASPVGLVSDPTILATRADGVLLVLDAQNTRKGAFRRAVRDLEAVGASMLGTVMNNVKLSEKGYYSYYGDYTYGAGR